MGRLASRRPRTQAQGAGANALARAPAKLASRQGLGAVSKMPLPLTRSSRNLARPECPNATWPSLELEL